MKALVEYGADTNFVYEKRSPLAVAIMNGNAACAELLYKAVGKFIFEGNSEDLTPLHAAALSGNAATVYFTLKTMNENVRERTIKGYSALELALSTGDSQSVKLLLANGADTKNLNQDKLSLWDLLFGKHPSALQNRKKYSVSTEECLGHLLEHGVKLDAKALDWSVFLGSMGEAKNLEIVIALLKGGMAVDERDSKNSTLLHCASRQGYSVLLEFLLSKKADPDVKDGDNSTPLHVAVSNGHLECVKALIKNTVWFGAQDNNGATPLSLAVSKNYQECAQALREAGAKR